MSFQLPRDQMSFADKLQAMELLWAELSKAPEQLHAPDWHRDVLRQRSSQTAEGTVEFLDWDDALKNLRKELHENQDS